MTKILIIGATSAIAEATARIYAETGAELFLVARDQAKLDRICADLTVRGAASAEMYCLDLSDIDGHRACLEAAYSHLGRIDVALIAHGSLGDQKACQESVHASLREISLNGMTTVAVMTALANLMKNQGSGSIAVISSVAGERGRKSNYVYGSSKALITAFASGLRCRLMAHNVHVLTVLPGPVDTPMTREMEKGPLWASAKDVAEGITGALKRRRNVVYLPAYWRFIMFVIRHIPEPIFKRLNL